MQKFLNLVISGTVTGAIYSIMASGLVLTYQTSGMFNFAHAGIAFTCAYFYYQLNSALGLPIVVSLVITVLLFAPLLGFLLDRVLLARLSTAPVYARIVGTLGVLLALPGLVQWVTEAVLVDGFGLGFKKLREVAGNSGFVPPGVGPTPPKVFRLSWLGLDNVNLSSDELAVFVSAALAAIVLYVVIRRSRIGLEMRAVVDRKPLAELRGVDPKRTSAVAWTISMTLAGLGGVLIAPLFLLDDETYQFVVLASLAAVAFAGLRSIPLAFAGGLALGVMQNLLAGYREDLLPGFLADRSGLGSAIPYIVLLIALFVTGRQRGRAAGTAAEERPPPDYRAGLAPWRRRLPWAIFVGLLILYTIGGLPFVQSTSYTRSAVLAPALVMSLVFLSIVVVTGMGGMISLAQATFLTTGGFAAGWALQTADATHPPPWASWDDIPFLVQNGRLNFLLGWLLGAVVAAIVGALIAYPVRRLGTLALALATFALAWVANFMIFQNQDFSNGGFGYSFAPPSLDIFGIVKFDFAKSEQFVLLLLAVIGLVILLIRNLERSASGRAMYAVRSSEVAARASGVSPARYQVALFALSAGIAGLAGALYGLANLSVGTLSAPPIVGLFWVAVTATFGVRRPGGALLAGLAATAFPVLFGELADFSWLPVDIGTAISHESFTPILFGLAAIQLAKNPDGVLAASGKNRVEAIRARDRKRRIAAAESALHHGEEVVVAPVPEEKVLDTVAQAPTAAEGGATPVLLVEDVVAGYGDVEVLHGVTIAVERGQIVALLGANGAGKSTLCGVTAGMIETTEGRVMIAYDDVSAALPHQRARRGMLLVPEARGIFPGLSVDENLAVFLRDPALRSDAYDRFPILGERRKQAAGLLSGGEQQMLSLAPALANPPLVLIADEPTLGLAPVAVEIVLDALRELRDRGTAVLLVEEKASEVMKVADVVAIMELGHIVWIGPRAEADAERLAAAYLGSVSS